MAAAKSSDSGQELINLLLIGLGAYLLWEFVIQPMIAQGQAATTTTQPTTCFDQGGNPIPCPPNVAPGTTVNQQVAAGVGQCFDQFGNVIQCPAGVTAGSSVVVSGSVTTGQTQPVVTPTTPTRTTLLQAIQQGTAAPMGATPSATRTAVATKKTALQPARGTAGLWGIVPGWPSGGGEAFSAFVPGGFSGGGFGGAFQGMTFGQGQGPFSSPPATGYALQPSKYVQ